MNYKLFSEIFMARRKTFLLIIGMFLLNICLYAYLASYQKPHLAGLQNEWFEKRQAARGGALVDAADIYAQGSRDLAAWRARILPKKDFARFLGELFELTANNNLSIKGITYKPAPINDENLLAYSISFNVIGKYAAIKSFLSDLVRSHEMVVVDTISLSNSSAIEEFVDLRIQITTYLKKEGT